MVRVTLCILLVNCVRVITLALPKSFLIYCAFLKLPVYRISLFREAGAYTKLLNIRLHNLLKHNTINLLTHINTQTSPTYLL